MKTSTPKKEIIKRKCNLISFLTLLLICLPLGIIIGFLLAYSAPTIINWSEYLWTRTSNAQDLIEIVLIFMIMGGLIILLFAGYFLLMELLVYGYLKLVIKIPKCYKEERVAIVIVILKLVGIISPFFLVPSFIDSIFISGILSFVFILFFIGVGFWGMLYISSLVMPENIVDFSEEELIEMFNKSEVKTRQEALNIIEQNKDFYSISKFIPILLKDNDISIRKSAINLIEESGDRNFVDNLIHMLADNDEFVRVYAAKALGTLGDKSVINVLKKAKLSVQKDIQFHFDEAISRLSE